VNDSLTAYYVNLLIIQYYDKPKARAVIETLITASMIYDLAVLVRDGFNLDTAMGPQLDTLAIYEGVSRTITGTAFDRVYFGYADYEDTTPFTYASYADYSDINIDAQFRSYVEENQTIYTLNDTELRKVLYLAVIKNNGIGSVKVIDDLLAEFFSGGVLFFERYPMAIGFIFQTGQERFVTILKAEDLLPRPSGVALSVSFTKDIGNMFGYKKYGLTKPDYIIGYREYGGPTTGGWKVYGEA
jgi:hypothetical protein